MERTSKLAIDSQRESDMKSRAYLLSFPLFLLCLLPIAAAQTNQTPSSTQPTQAQTTQPTQTQASTPDSTQQQPAQQPVSTGQAPPPADTQPAASQPSNSSSTATPAATSEKHDGGINDIDAIGNRKMGGGKLGNWYSLEKEIQMGKSYAQQVEASVKLVQDPVVTEYVNRIGQNLVRNSDAKVPFTIKVVDSDEINAFALPGGFFYVNSGLILAADNESELAGVMAHEIAHVAARHATRQMTRAQYANFATIPLIFVGGGIGYAAYNAMSLALPLTFLSFSREFEAQADYLGLEYMYKTGYDPQSFIAFFEKVEAKEKKKPGTLAKAFSTHPPTPDRIEKSQEEIAKVLPSKPEYVLDTSEFDSVKARLAVLENRHKIQEEKDTNRPTLRRTSSGDSTNTGSGNGNSTSSNSGSNSGDDRPTLKKRDD
jgi:beta-barrel assembly-enhancing protease